MDTELSKYTKHETRYGNCIYCWRKVEYKHLVSAVPGFVYIGVRYIHICDFCKTNPYWEDKTYDIWKENTQNIDSPILLLQKDK